MRFQEFCGGSASERVSTINMERSINWQPVLADSGTPKAPIFLQHTPGLRPFIVLNDGPVRALFAEDGRCYAVAGTSFFEIFANQSANRYGAVDTDGFAPTISTNGSAGHQLFVTSGGSGYIFDLIANTLTKITDADFVTPTACGVFVDGYFVSLVRGTRQFQLSDLEDGLSWSGLDVGEMSQSSDNVISMAVHRRELWFAGSKTTEVWANTGAANFPFAPVPGAMLWQGTMGLACTTELDGSLFTLGQSANGARVVYRSNGYSMQRISTHAIEAYLAQAPRVDDIVTYGYQEEGHAHFVIHVPSLPTTLVYDVAGPPRHQWHERADWDTTLGQWRPHPARCHAFAFGKHLVGDYNSPAVYEMSLDFDTDQLVELT
jgi:hypothetical protein